MNSLISDALQKNYTAEMRKLVGGWLLRPNTAVEAWGGWGKVNLAIKYEMQEEALALTIATLKKQAEATKRDETWLRAEASFLNFLGKLGDRSCTEAIQLVESLLDDDSEIPTFMQTNSKPIRLSELALFVLVRMTGQKFEDYELVDVKTYPENFLIFDSASFENAESRARAIAKWKAWSKANLKAATKSS